MRSDQTVKHDVGEALLLVAGEQAAEHRIAVVAREAPPHDPPERIDQRDGAAVADDGEIEVLLRGGDIDVLANIHRFSWEARTISPIQRRTSLGVSNIPAMPCTSRPTEKPTPSNSGSTSKAASSVTSSPMKIGLRPLKGICCIKSRTAVPLLNEGCFTSTTDLPGKSSGRAEENRAQVALTSARIS